MGRYFVWALGVGFGLALNAAPAVAQTHVDIGVFTPNVGAHVVLGGPRVYVPPPRVVYAPRPRVVYVPARRVYVVERYRHDRGRHRGWERSRGRFVRVPYGYRDWDRGWDRRR